MMPYFGTYEETKAKLTKEWSQQRAKKVAELERKKKEEEEKLKNLDALWGRRDLPSYSVGEALPESLAAAAGKTVSSHSWK